MLTYKISLFRFKRALKVRDLLLLKLKYLIRAEFLTTHNQGSEEEFENVAHIAAIKLLKPEIFEADDDFPMEDNPDDLRKAYDEINIQYAEKKLAVDSIIQEISNKEEVREILRDYWLIQHFVESQKSKKDKNMAQRYIYRVKNLGFAPTILTCKDLYIVRHAVRKDIKELRKIISDYEALKINISARGIAVLVSVASPLFLITGYLYNSLLFDAFGIDASKFFTLLDYIAASASKLGYTFYSAVLSTVFYFLGAHYYSRKPAAEKMYMKDKPMYSLYFITALFFILSVIGFFLGTRLFYNNASLTIILLSLLLLPDLCWKYFEKPLPILFVFVFVVCFFANLWASLGKTINELKYGELDGMKTYDIRLEDSLSSIPTSHLVLIAANSGFFFFLDQDRKIHIINKNQVGSLVQRKEVSSKRSYLFPSIYGSEGRITR